MVERHQMTAGFDPGAEAPGRGPQVLSGAEGEDAHDDRGEVGEIAGQAPGVEIDHIEAEAREPCIDPIVAAARIADPGSLRQAGLDRKDRQFDRAVKIGRSARRRTDRRHRMSGTAGQGRPDDDPRRLRDRTAA